MLLSFWSSETVWTSLFRMAWIVEPYVGVFVLFDSPTSLDAKNASTTTIKMGKAALLKKRLIVAILAPRYRPGALGGFRRRKAKPSTVHQSFRTATNGRLRYRLA